MNFEDLPEKNIVKSNSSLLDIFPPAKMFANGWDGKGRYLDRPLKIGDSRGSSSIFGTDGKPGVYCLSKDRFIYSSSSVNYYNPEIIEDNLSVYIFNKREGKFVYRGSTFCLSAKDARNAVSLGAKKSLTQVENLTKIVYDRAYKKRKQEEKSESMNLSNSDNDMLRNMLKFMNPR